MAGAMDKDLMSNFAMPFLELAGINPSSVIEMHLEISAHHFPVLIVKLHINDAAMNFLTLGAKDA